MRLNFYKYQATGNDFILIDNRQELFNGDLDTIKSLCDRRFGIGGDGVILIENHSDYDFEMVFYNPDGSMSLCGNGSRCAVRFAQKLGLVENEATFLAHDGVHTATITPENIKLKMSDVQSVRLMGDGIFVDTGSPHYVQFVADVSRYNVYDEGKKIRSGGLFGTAGTNVNFVEIMKEDSIFVRTFERGVENETLSCGTGVTACAIASNYRELSSPVSIKTLGGNLRVDFTKAGHNSFSDVYLTGPAELVFDGSVELS